jgi:VWFA-related protein
MRTLRAILAAALLAAPAVAAAQTFVESTEVVVVEVPVQVIRDGEPVRGLTAADFEVFDGREKQTLTGFERVDLEELSPEAAATAELPVSARRHFLVLFDLTFSSPKALMGARGAAKDMVEALHPTDLVAVGTWSARRGAQLILGFTSDRRQVAAALDTFGLPELLDNQPPDPLRLALVEGADSSTYSPTAGARQGPAAAEAGGIAADILGSITRLTEEARAVDLTVAVRDLSRSMADFAQIMGGIDGRKYVVWLSEGFDPAVLQGGRTYTGEQSSPLEPGTTDAQYGGTQGLNAVERMLEELRRADCAVQAVDIAGLRGQGDLGGRKVSGQDVLLNFAKGTGGELYEKTNDLGGAMQQMLRRTGVTYVLSFQPEKVGEPETFHRLRVEVKNQPRGTRVVHRPGWYAPKPYMARSPIEKMMSAASQLLGGEEGGPIRTALLAAPFRAAPEDNGKAYVPVLLEIEGRSLLAGTPSGTLPAEIYVYALDRQGAVHGYVAQTIGLDVAKVGAGLQQSGLKFFGHLDLHPGEYRLRALVRNGATGAATMLTRELTVPTFADAGPVLLPPFFPEASGKWLIVREAQRAGQKAVPYPFLMGEEPYVPASRPVLVPGQEARLSLVVYNLGTGAVRVRARVVGADGKEVGGGRIKLLEHRPGPPDRLLASYDPPQLPPGEYNLQVTLTDGSGASRTSSTPFVVGAGSPAGA